MDADLRKIYQKVLELETKIDSSKETRLEDYIPESEAKKILKRGTTWFWELRQGGFPYSKLGGEVHYRKSDFVKYFEDRMQGGEFFDV